VKTLKDNRRMNVAVRLW